MLEKYACHGCGAVFGAGYGPNNIRATPHRKADAKRDGDCPVCGASKPLMTHVGGAA